MSSESLDDPAPPDGYEQHHDDDRKSDRESNCPSRAVLKLQPRQEQNHGYSDPGESDELALLTPAIRVDRSSIFGHVLK